MRINPYRPGAGTTPPILAGRDELIASVSTSMLQVSSTGIGERPVVIWGLRGMGKTVLLNHFVSLAKSNNWFVVKFEARADEDLPRKIAQEMAAVLRRQRVFADIARDAMAKSLRVLKSFQLSFDPTGIIAINSSIEPEPGYADSGNAQLDFLDVCETIGEAARSLDIGVLIAVDELQEASLADLKTVNMTLHALGQDAEPVPVYFIGTGLPTLPGILSKANTYAERLYQYHELESLDEAASEQALAIPAEHEGVSWSAEAMDYVTSLVKGYPYFIQQCGRCAWDVIADEAREIALDDAVTGAAIAIDEIDRGLYQARWDRATNSERTMMMAMAQLGGLARIQDVAKGCGKTKASQLSVTRDNLIKAGQIYSPQIGYVDFTVPGMADYIVRKHAR